MKTNIHRFLIKVEQGKISSNLKVGCGVTIFFKFTTGVIFLLGVFSLYVNHAEKLSLGHFSSK
jgi:hypothetical protein